MLNSHSGSCSARQGYKIQLTRTKTEGQELSWDKTGRLFISCFQPNSLDRINFFFFFCQLKQELIDLGRGNQEDKHENKKFPPSFHGLSSTPSVQPQLCRGDAQLTAGAPPSALPCSISSFPGLAVPFFCSTLPTPCSSVSYPSLDASSRGTTHKADGLSFVWEPTALSLFLQKLFLHAPIINNLPLTFNPDPIPFLLQTLHTSASNEPVTAPPHILHNSKFQFNQSYCAWGHTSKTRWTSREI